MKRGPRGQSLQEKFWARVSKDGAASCWPWRGPVTSDGFPYLSNRGRCIFARRFAYELLVGPIPDGMTVSTTCPERRCLNPAHLVLVKRGAVARPGEHSARMRKAWEWRKGEAEEKRLGADAQCNGCGRLNREGRHFAFNGRTFCQDYPACSGAAIEDRNSARTRFRAHGNRPRFGRLPRSFEPLWARYGAIW